MLVYYRMVFFHSCHILHYRATVDHHIDSFDGNLPPVKVTIANNDIDFIIR